MSARVIRARLRMASLSLSLSLSLFTSHGLWGYTPYGLALMVMTLSREAIRLDPLSDSKIMIMNIMIIMLIIMIMIIIILIIVIIVIIIIMNNMT